MSENTFTFGKVYDETKVPALVDANGTALPPLVKGAYDSMVKIWIGGRVKASIYKRNIVFDEQTYQVVFNTRD